MKKWTILVMTGMLLMSCFDDGGGTEPTDHSPDPEKMAFIDGGTFQMGDRFSEGGGDELPLHSVTVSDFYIGLREITQAEWSVHMPAGDWNTNGSGDYYPAYDLSWYEVLKYCNLRSIAEGLTPCYSISGTTDPAAWGAVPAGADTAWDTAACNWSANGYRMPTEAEWEYAARGGVYNSDNFRYSGSNTSDIVSWTFENSVGKAHPVGEKAANQLGLWDMSGNVWELCWDWYSMYTSDAQTDPAGPASGSFRILRGGYWGQAAVDSRVSKRGWTYSYSASYAWGFRVARTR